MVQIFVENKVNLLQIIILKNGSIAAAGNFDTLSASGLDFAKLLAREEEEEKPAAESSITDVDSESILHGSFRKRQMSIHSVSTIYTNRYCIRKKWYIRGADFHDPYLSHLLFLFTASVA